MNSYRVVHELNQQQFDELVGLYTGEWWSTGRSPESVRIMLGGPGIVVAIVDGDGHLAAFSRVLSDGAYWALLFDVIVHPDHRGEGIGRMLMDAVLAHPKVRSVRSVALCCRPELCDFYAQWGFKIDPPDEVVWMRRRQ